MKNDNKKKPGGHRPPSQDKGNNTDHKPGSYPPPPKTEYSRRSYDVPLDDDKKR